MKLSLFQHYLKERKMDWAVFIHPDPAITYFTQHEFSSSVLLISPQKAILYLTKLDPSPKLSRISIKPYSKEWAKDIKGKVLGLSKECLTVKEEEKLRDNFPKAKFLDVSGKVKELRMLKTKEEIKYITKACQITSRALAELVKELPCHKLKTEQDAAYFLEKNIHDQGAEIAFPTIVASASNAAIPHHHTSNQKLKKGFLLIDVGAKYHHYCSDMSRVLYLGQPKKAEREFYELLRVAQEEGLKQLSLGRPFSEIDPIVRKKLGKYSSYFVHSLGHGVGIEIHEAPSFMEAFNIQDQQVFTIEPGLYFPNKFGLRIEDTVLFYQKARVLTKAPKKLIIIKWLY